MKQNIKKAAVKFREDLLYFSILCCFLSLSQISDYHHLKCERHRWLDTRPVDFKTVLYKERAKVNLRRKIDS